MQAGVRSCRVESHGAPNARQHGIVLSGIHADMPECQFLARWPGVNAQLPCGYCRIQSTLHGKHYYPEGYLAPIRHDLLKNPAQELKANAPHLWIGHRSTSCPLDLMLCLAKYPGCVCGKAATRLPHSRAADQQH